MTTTKSTREYARRTTIKRKPNADTTTMTIYIPDAALRAHIRKAAKKKGVLLTAFMRDAVIAAADKANAA